MRNATRRPLSKPEVVARPSPDLPARDEKNAEGLAAQKQDEQRLTGWGEHQQDEQS